LVVEKSINTTCGYKWRFYEHRKADKGITSGEKKSQIELADQTGVSQAAVSKMVQRRK